MTIQTPHRTPLRKVSRGSLFSHSRPDPGTDTSHGLSFLQPAISDFVDETEALLENIQAMQRLSGSLATFNESFASWLYVMDMNALTTDWPQAPTDASFILAKRRAEEVAIAARELIKKTELPRPDVAYNKTAVIEGATEPSTMMNAANVTSVLCNQTGKPKKKAGKTKMTAKEKKERALELERIILSLPLEFRGTDPNLRRNMEAVIEGLLDAPEQRATLNALIKLPDLPQARVNKCLLALINRKIVQKDSSSGIVLYHWKGTI